MSELAGERRGSPAALKGGDALKSSADGVIRIGVGVFFHRDALRRHFRRWRFLAKSMALIRNNRCRWILTIWVGVDANVLRRRGQRSGLMQKRMSVQKRGSDGSLPELLNRLELALAETPARTSVCRALLDLNRRLDSARKETPARISRFASPRRRRQPVVESLSLFS
ncbi:hypothetical protein [Paraburkholderia elongata]|uniref:Uncharacterized protein n=1 Tax=Paraburkholderia elongata TaxID=2675747 RepID=A0A972NZ99_9BURK|nr:hypothetical protein [Paraburkholderia elongata]NPT62613.1 hypothetical protein [Paraburkholderia elongata]